MLVASFVARRFVCLFRRPRVTSGATDGTVGTMPAPDEINRQTSSRRVCLPLRSTGTLTRLRIVSGLTQRELAGRAGVSPESVSNWERGLSQPRYVHAAAIADALDCDVRLVFPEISGRDEPVECPYCHRVDARD